MSRKDRVWQSVAWTASATVIIVIVATCVEYSLGLAGITSQTKPLAILFFLALTGIWFGAFSWLTFLPVAIFFGQGGGWKFWCSTAAAVALLPSIFTIYVLFTDRESAWETICLFAIPVFSISFLTAIFYTKRLNLYSVSRIEQTHDR